MDDVSVHAALLFLLCFWLVQYILLLRLPSLWFVCLVRILLVDFLSFDAFSSLILFTSETHIIHLLVSAFALGCSA